MRDKYSGEHKGRVNLSPIELKHIGEHYANKRIKEEREKLRKETVTQNRAYREFLKSPDHQSWAEYRESEMEDDFIRQEREDRLKADMAH